MSQNQNQTSQANQTSQPPNEPKLPSGHVLVLGEGPRDAQIALVGEAPGENEARLRRPFVGTAGAFLDKLLVSARLDRSRCFVTNVVKVRPPKNALNRLSELGLHIQDFTPYLFYELNQLPELKVIVCLGNLPLSTLTEFEGITKYRGSVLKALGLEKDVWVVPTLHPSYIMQYAFNMYAVAIQDLTKAREIATNGFVRKTRTKRTRPSLIDAIDYIERCAQSKAFSLDIETTHKKISCVGLALSSTDSMCIPFKNGYDNFWSYSEELSLWECLGQALSSQACKVVQNAKYDFIFMKDMYGVLPNPPYFDTLIAHSILYPELPHDLAFMTAQYTDMAYYKDDVKDWKGIQKNEVLWEYNCKDVLSTFEIYEHELAELRQTGLYDFFCGFSQPLYRVLIDIQTHGLTIDSEAVEKVKRQLTEQKRKLQEEINKNVGYELNVNSPKQVAKFLYEDLKLPQQRNRRTGRVTADERALLKLYARYPNEVFKLVLDLRGIDKMLGTYVNAKRDPDGKIRTSYGTTETGRLSSSLTIDKTGMNVQNVPAQYRSVFVPSKPENELMEPDLEQAEARAVAFLANCKPMIQAFNEGKDVFKLIASWIHDKKIEDVTKDERYIAKRVSHGSHYGMRPRLFAEHVGLPVKQATAIQARYFAMFPEIRRWQMSIEQTLRKSRTLETPYGRKRRFFGRLNIDTFKEAYAYCPQSLVGDTLNLALLKLFYSLPNDCHILLQVHDSLLVEYPKTKREEVIRLVKRAFDKQIKINQELSLKIPVGLKLGDSWGTLKEIDLET